MNQDEFEAKVKAIHERVLSKNSSAEEENTYTESLFESIKHINEYGQEVWYARELAKVLDYKDFRNFELIIFKAMEACRNSENEISDHFGEFTEMVPHWFKCKKRFQKLPNITLRLLSNCNERRSAKRNYCGWSDLLRFKNKTARITRKL